MKRSIALMMVITLFLLMQLSGCARKTEKTAASLGGTSSSPSAETAAENEIPAVSQEPELDFTYNESDCTPWQLAYLSLLRDIGKREAPVRLAQADGSADGDAIASLSYSYCLYDVDKDAIPEILIRFGQCEADFHTQVYTCRSDSAIFVGDFSSGESGLYTYPSENAVLLDFGHMGYSYMDKISIIDSALVTREIYTEDTSENSDSDYTEPDKIVPGAVYLHEFRTTLNLPEYTPLTLPIYDYNSASSSGNTASADADKKAIAEVLAGNRKLYGVSGDGFGGDTGWMSFSDYCQPGAAYQYAGQPLQIKKSAWIDFNSDGRGECILVLAEAGQTSASDEIYVLLSEQDGVVYAYCINYSCDAQVYQDGVFGSSGDWTFGISFYKNQCYQYSKSHAAGIPAADWLTQNA